MKLAYTLGTSTRSPGEFLKLLKTHRVEVVVDVRRFPTSRLEHFRQEKLVRLLGEADIDYIYLGEELGGYRRQGYTDFTITTQFQVGLKKLAEIARKKKTAFICAERFPWRCHRRFIARELEKRSWHVVHIIDPGRDWIPRTPARPEVISSSGQQ